MQGSTAMKRSRDADMGNLVGKDLDLSMSVFGDFLKSQDQSVP